MLELGAQPGKYRAVGLHGACTWFLDHPDGTVSFVVRRTADSGRRHGEELAFHCATDEEALAEYEAWSTARNEENMRRARRMERWGP